VGHQHLSQPHQGGRDSGFMRSDVGGHRYGSA
jgi:hypothetical protein